MNGSLIGVSKKADMISPSYADDWRAHCMNLYVTLRQYVNIHLGERCGYGCS